MALVRRIFFITYPGAALLDFAGPSGVFSVVNELLEHEEAYDIHCLSSHGGLIKQNTGLPIYTEALTDIEFKPSDTVLVIGAPEQALNTAACDPVILDALRDADRICSRYGSICTGALVLSAAGLLDGRKSCTHWSSQKLLQRSAPLSTVDFDSLYTVDKNLWMSAGVTTGIDMALAMVEADYGRVIKSQVARHLLVYTHRAGHQAQFSDILLTQTRTDTKFARLIDWLNDNLKEPIKVEDMADFMNMSPRSFHRHFSQIFDQPPSQFLTHIRLDKAQKLLEAGESVELVAGKVGFKSVPAFRTAFRAYIGMTPSSYAGMVMQC
ncbi:MAG: GlxA family transcriptional regulator [Neptuniibacter sp.]